MVAMNVEESTWNRNIQSTVNAAVASEGLISYCQEVMVAKNCIMMTETRPAKIRVRRLNLSIIYEPNKVNTKYTPVVPVAVSSKSRTRSLLRNLNHLY